MLDERVINEGATGLARLRGPDGDDEQRARFAGWLAQDAQNKAAFGEMTELWESLAVVKELKELPADPRVPVLGKLRLKALLPLAASILVAVGAAVFLQLSGQTYETAVGVVQEIALQDGSTVHLNTDSRIEVRFTDAQRLVELERGEAYFQVAPNIERPFVVVTSDGLTTAIGTAFAVRRRATLTEVTVAEGVVAVAAFDGASVELHAGEQGRLDAGSAMKTPDIDVARTAWIDGRLEYRGVPLAELIEDFSRYLPENVVIRDEDLRALRVSAGIQIGDHDRMLEALADAVPIRYVKVADGLIILTSE